jgi:hypothetical protein
VSVVVPQQPAEPLATLDLAFGPADLFSRFKDRVTEPLVISLTVIVAAKLANTGSQRLVGDEEYFSPRNPPVSWTGQESAN